MPKTEEAEYAYIVKESPNGPPWIMLELRRGAPLSILEHGFLGFRLSPGTTLEEAHEIARFMEDKLIKTTCTTFRGAD